MTGKKLAELTDVSPLAKGDSLYLERGGESRRAEYDTGYALSDTGFALSDTGFALSDTGFALSDTGQFLSDTGAFSVSGAALQASNLSDLSDADVAFTNIANPAGGLNTPYNLGLAVSASAGALTISLKGADGNDPSATNPVLIPFRDAAHGTGTPSFLSVEAATSLTVSSGSTLGVTSSTAFHLWVVGFNDAGTFRLGVINCSNATTIFPLTEWGVRSGTAEGGAGAADSAGVIYTGTAVTSKAFRILGFIQWSSVGVTAGTWTTTNLNRLQLFGPGVHKPGDVVQTVFFHTDAVTTTTSATPAATALTDVIAPVAAANLILISQTFRYTITTNGTAGTCQIYRGSTALDSVATVFADGGGNNQTIAALQTIDKPNTTANTTYALFTSRSAGTGNHNAPSAYGTQVLQEFMG